MPRKRLQEVQSSFASGLIGGSYSASDINFFGLPDDSLTLAQYCRITRDGSLAKLQGTRRIHTTAIDGANQIVGGHSWRKGDGTVQQLVTTDNLFTGSYALPTTWTSRTGALDNTKKHCFAPFRDGTGEVVYIADGGLLNKWDGTNVSVDIAGSASVARIASYNQRLFGINGTDQTLYWSALNNGDSLGNAGASGGQAVIRTFGGQNLTALAAVGSSLLLFHANAISRFTGYAQTDINIDAGTVGHAAEVGTLAPRSVVVVDVEGRDVAFFLTKRGLYMAGESSVAPVYTPFRLDLVGLGDTTAWQSVHAVHHAVQNELWIFLPTIGAYIYNYVLKCWTGPHGFNNGPNVSWLGETNLGGQVILTGGSDGFVRHFDYPNTALQDVLSDGTGGGVVQMAANTRPWTFGDDSLDKSLRHLYVSAESVGGVSNVQIQWQTDKGDLGSGTFASGTFGTVALPMWGVGKYVSISIADNGSYPTLFVGLRGEAFALGRRR